MRTRGEGEYVAHVEPTEAMGPTEPKGATEPKGPTEPTVQARLAWSAGATIPVVRGPVVDAHTRCIHYATPVDVIAIRFACCGEYYPCHRCHDETADHPSRPWPQGSDDVVAVLCGQCWSELTIGEYRVATGCPRCGALFNPRCAAHHPIYFG